MKTVKLPKTDRMAVPANATETANVPPPNAQPEWKGPGPIPNIGITVPKMKIQVVHLKVVGKTPLIVHAWSSKAVKMMLSKQTGEASPGREKKDPLKDYKESYYRMPNGKGFGIPAPAFKGCAVSAANDVELKMTEVKRAVHVPFYTVKIEAPPLDKIYWTEWDYKYETELKEEHAAGAQMRQDIVRLQSGVADIRFRACWPIWSCDLEVEFNATILSLEQVVNLFDQGGYGVGVCEWRPGAPECRTGEYGRFSVAR